MTQQQRFPTGDVVVATQAVRSVWAALLPTTPFEIEKTWRDAGLDSLRALEFAVRVERALDTRINFDAMAPECTVSDLINRLTHHSVSQTQLDARTRIFLIPGIFGDDPRLAQFRKALNREIKFETLELPDLHCSTRLLSDVAATAASLTNRVIELQPEGDILLAGYSYGSIVAQDMACQLEAKGRNVSFLALLDGLLFPPSSRKTMTDRSASEFNSRSVLLMKSAWAQAMSTLRNRSWFRQLTRRHENSKCFLDRAIFSILMRVGAWEAVRRFLFGAESRQDWRWTKTRSRFLIARLRGWSVMQWRPGVSNAPTLLIASCDFASQSSVEVWQNACPHLHVVSVQFDHQKIFEPASMTTIIPAFLEALAKARCNALAAP